MATQPPDDAPQKPDAPSEKPDTPCRCGSEEARCALPASPLPPKKPPVPPTGGDSEVMKKKPPLKKTSPAPAGEPAPGPADKPTDQKTEAAADSKQTPDADAATTELPAAKKKKADPAADSKQAPDAGAVTTEPAAAKKKKADKPADQKTDPAADATGVTTEPSAAKKMEEGIVAGKDKEGVAAKPKRFSFTWPSFKKAAPTGVWGIDLGQCGLKAVRLEEINGEVVATAFEYVEHPKILSQPDADPDELTRDALIKFLAQNKVGGDLVAISVPGQSGLARFVKLPPVEEKKIADIVRFEAKQQIPFNLDEVVWDYQKLGAGEVMDGLALDAEIGLFAMKRDAVNRYLQHFKDVKVEVHCVQMAPLALSNFLAFDILKKVPGGSPAGEEAETPKGEDKGCIAALDIGADSSSLVITDGERIIWQRPIPLGGNHFTRALTKDLKLTFAKAEHLKRNATKSPDLKAILAALKPVLNDFVGEVQRSLNFFTSSHRSASIDYLIGLGNAFRLPGLQSYLKEKLQLNVVKLQKFERLTGATVVGDQRFADNVLTFAVAYGLALQGLKRTRLQTNLLPSEIREERIIRAKKPMAVAAAGLLLLGLGMFAFGRGMTARPWKSDEVKGATAKAKTVVAAVKKADSEFEAARAEAKREEAAVNGLLAGQAEFRNWVDLDAFVRGSIPQPDASNLPTASEQSNPYQKYFLDAPTAKQKEERAAYNQRPMSGQQAFLKLREVQVGLAKAERPARASALSPPSGIPGGKGLVPMPGTGPAGMRPPGEAGGTTNLVAASTEEALPEGIDDLIQINVESIEARYSDDLEAVWNRARVNREGNERGHKILPFKPKEKGWVVEVRGYTYHSGHDAFIKETFLDNLAQRGLPDKSDGKSPLPDRGAVLNRVSHFLLYTSVEKGGPDDPTGPLLPPLSVARSPVLDDVLQGAASGSGVGPGKGGGPAPNIGPSGRTGTGSGSSRSGWRPLGGNFNTTSSNPGTGGRLSNQPPPPAANPTDPGKVPDKKTEVEGTLHRRTEFVILFFWREPTPSDIMRGQTDAPPAAPPGPGAPPTPGAPPAPGR